MSMFRGPERASSDCDTGPIQGTQLASEGRTRPEWKPYVWHDPDAERHAGVQATLARIRAQAARNIAGEVPG